MNVQEFDTALSDLETRVDRLRALYENWFRGYEKMEPSVARKDVERRVYGLRKELPRNTALRFRYHQLYQRYTTLATYWQRTARQIEEGTYRLQLQRMKRRRVDDDVLLTKVPPPKGDDDVTIPPPSYELSLDESLDVQRLLEEADIDEVARAIDRPGPFSTPVPARSASKSAAPPKPAPAAAASALNASAPSVTSARFARPSVANDVTPVRPAGVPPTVVGAAKPPAVPPAAAAAAGPPKPPPLKIPLPNAPGAGTGTMPGLPIPRIAARPNGPGTGTVPMPPPPRVPGSGLDPARPGAPPVLGASAPMAGARPSSANAAPKVPGAPVAPPAGAANATAKAPSAPNGAPAVAASTPAARTPAPAAGSEASSAGAGTAPGVPSTPKPAPVFARPAGLPARPSLATGAAGAAPARPAAPAAARAQTPPPSAASAQPGLDEQRMRRIYDEYTAARKKNNEGDVRFETLQGTIQKMLPDLSKKHQGKQIDFEVVLKDGRVGLKPKAT